MTDIYPMKDVIVFYPEDFQRFIDALKEAVKEGVKEHFRGYVVEEPMTMEEAARYLLISVGTLRQRIKKGVIPGELVHHAGGAIYFLPSELYNFLKRS